MTTPPQQSPGLKHGERSVEPFSDAGEGAGLGRAPGGSVGDELGPDDEAAKAIAAKRPAPAASPGAGIPENATALPKAKLQVLSGAFAGRELELTKALTTLGRPGVQVAAITRRSEGYFLVHVDADSAENFPQVNGAPIGAQARKLVDNDVIQLAGVKMGFFEG